MLPGSLGVANAGSAVQLIAGVNRASSATHLRRLDDSCRKDFERMETTGLQEAMEDPVETSQPRAQACSDLQAPIGPPRVNSPVRFEVVAADSPAVPQLEKAGALGSNRG